MKLYFVIYTDEDGDNMDWFVIAHDRTEAVKIWRRDNCIEPGIADGPSTVFLVPAVVSTISANAGARLLEWSRDVELA